MQPDRGAQPQRRLLAVAEPHHRHGEHGAGDRLLRGHAAMVRAEAVMGAQHRALAVDQGDLLDRRGGVDRPPHRLDIALAAALDAGGDEIAQGRGDALQPRLGAGENVLGLQGGLGGCRAPSG